MKAVVLNEPRGALPIQNVDDPTCPADGVIVSLRACGVCRSDHHAWVGADPDVVFPHVMGHELAGEIVDVGRDVTQFEIGDRVTAPFILGCGTCADCSGGEATVCNHQEVIGFTIWGAFAEYLSVPRADFNLVRLPDSLPFDVAAGMGCRVTTAWRAISDRAALQPGEWLAVHGCGGVGLSAVLIAKALGARIIAVDISQDALAMAHRFGADHTVDANAADAAEQVRALTKGGADVSVEALGITKTFDASLRSLRKLGRHIQVGMPVGSHATPPLPLLELIYARQLTLHGTRGIGAAGFADLLDLVQSGRLDLSHLVTKRISLGDTHEVLAAMDGTQPPGVTVITDFTT